MIAILVLEDNSDLNQSVCRHLSLNGYKVTGCTNALDAYDVLYEQKIDLIISDIMMPDIDGFEFAKSVRENNPDILLSTPGLLSTRSWNTFFFTFELIKLLSTSDIFYPL